MLHIRNTLHKHKYLENSTLLRLLIIIITRPGKLDLSLSACSDGQQF